MSVMSGFNVLSIGVMYDSFIVCGTDPHAIERFINFVMYGIISSTQSFNNHTGHGSRSHCFGGADLNSLQTFFRVSH